MRLNDGVVLGMGDLPTQSAVACDGDCSYPDGEVTYGANGHTNELVILSALGMGSTLFSITPLYQGEWYPGTRIVDNTAIHAVMLAASGLTGSGLGSK